MNKYLTQYIDKYAEKEVCSLVGLPASLMFEQVLVIPAYKEDISFIQRYLNSELSQLNVLIILVINQPEQDIDKEPQARLYEEALRLGTANWQHDNLTLLAIEQSSTHLLLVDRFTFPIPEKQGVGLARKIGVDIAVSMMNKNIISSTWIHSSDADTQLPNSYFSATKNCDQRAVAGCYNFVHQCNDDNINRANQQYERALRYYVDGLIYAGSPYAFFTIGSVLTFDAIAYAKVRGFPKRSAGEDFYLLNKLAKLGQVVFFKNETLIIEARTSDRVPFGTGPAVSKIMELNEENKPYCYYHPQVFKLLKQALAAFENLWQQLNNVDAWYGKLSKELNTVLNDIGLATFIAKHQQVNESQFNKQLIVWFDAFKTLKFIHSAREHFYADIPLETAVEMSEFT